MRRNARIASVAAIAGMVLSIPLAASANTLPTPDDVATTVTELSAADLQESAADLSTAEERAEVVEDFVEARARDGLLLDTSDVEAAVTEDVAAVWTEGMEIEEVTVTTATAEGDDTHVVGEEIDVATFPVELDEEESADLMVVGLAMAEAGTPTGGSLKGTDCMTAVSRRASNHEGNYVTHCYQKFKLTYTLGSSDFWFYNRYGTAYGGKGVLSQQFKPVSFTLASRPHKNYTSRVTGLVNYFPKDGSNICSSSGTFGYSYQGFNLSIPISSCANVHPKPNSTSKSMSVTFSDSYPYTGPISKGIDFGMTVKAPRGLTPYFGDYATAKFCDKMTVCGYSTTTTHMSSGW